MKLFKRIIAAVCAAAAALTLAGCADISKMGKIEDVEIPAGVYLWYAQTAVQEARGEIDDQLEEMGTDMSSIENFSYFDYNVQDKTYSQYVQDKTMEYVKQYVAIQKQFDEMGLTLTDVEKSEVTDSAKELWNTEITYYGYNTGTTYGENYESLGISRQSYTSVQLVQKMSNKLFDAYYDENGVTATDEEDIKTYFNDNYGRFQVIQVALKDGNGDKIETDEGKAAYKKLADSYLERLEKGEAFDEVYHDYEEYVAEQQALAEKEDEKDASSDETSSDTSSDDTSSDTTSDDTEEEEHDHEMLVSKEDTTPSEEVVKWLFELKEEEGGVYDDDDYYYVALRKPLLEREDWYEQYRSGILHLMKDEDYSNVLNEIAKDYTVDLSQAALDAYTPEKLKA